MVEQIVDFTLGFVICGLIGLALLPLVSARARRLTLARIEARLPMTFDEIEADRDLLRARFAVENRALELKAEEARNERAADAAELGRRAVAVARANEQLAQTSALLDERNAQLAKSLEFGEKTQASLDETREALATKHNELVQKSSDFDALAKAHRELDIRANDLSLALETATANLQSARSRYQAAETARRETYARIEPLEEHGRTLAAALAEAERRLADFDARRTRLMAKIEAERHRGDEHENTVMELRRQLAQKDEPAVNGAGPSPLISPEQEMLDLRDAITRIGRQVARLNMVEE